ncbi:MAG: SUMF1/EgtB/PvdO family nonheme iron enzyme, partial [Prolixibacteraceae bacterium]|nr:SUMF1/EgtB/PvdO family nonheme iron enzyme [Prolixibacteraceae bacterium]
MKKLLFVSSLVIIAFGFIGCSSFGSKGGYGNGELVGVSRKGKWKESAPLGMVLVRRGVINIGPSDQDPASATIPARTVSVEAFWIDDTEITNSEYRQFIEWVRDSTARHTLGQQYPEFLITEDKEGNPLDPPRIDWRPKIRWNDPDYIQALQDMYIPDNERFHGKREIDSRKLFFEYWWIDYQQAARRVNSYNYETQKYDGTVFDPEGNEIAIQDRSSFIFKDKVHVYPDTLCWIRDFTYSYNEPWATRYFWHPGFSDYPVVGVTWKQARAFCSWRTKIQSDYLTAKSKPELMEYRLPTEVEWEYAARGQRKFSMYPWGGYYTRDKQGV